jgi:hypothetical protein
MTTIPLSILDELYLNLDRDHEPWTVHYELALHQRLDPERLVSAIKAAAQRHPLARAPGLQAGAIRIGVTAGRSPLNSTMCRYA